MDAVAVKQLARDLGADLVGIAAAETLNAFPPDPKYPQTPARISPGVKSVIVIVSRIPTGAFRCKAAVPVQYMDMLVMRRMDRIAYRLVDALDEIAEDTPDKAARLSRVAAAEAAGKLGGDP